MTVLKSKRNISTVQFLQTARELQVYLIKQSVKMPKRYTFIINNKIADLATKIFIEAKSANSIYPINKEEVQIRRNHINAAIASLYSLISMIDLAKEIFNLEERVMIKSMALISEELKLLKALKNKDRERFRDL